MITSRPDAWDQVVDVVVLGSGAAGLSAAILAHDGQGLAARNAFAALSSTEQSLLITFVNSI